MQEDLKKWCKDEHYDHRYIQIEPNINEDELHEMLDNPAVIFETTM
jgi:hypothetical protein